MYNYFGDFMDIENKIKEILDKIKPLLNNDGGEIQNTFYGFDHFAQEDV